MVQTTTTVLTLATREVEELEHYEAGIEFVVQVRRPSNWTMYHVPTSALVTNLTSHFVK